MTPLGLFIPRRWESAFLGIARRPAAQSSLPSEAGILKGPVRDCFRCEVKTRELKKINAEADFFFIWGDLGFSLPRLSAHLPKDRALFYLGQTP